MTVRLWVALSFVLMSTAYASEPPPCPKPISFALYEMGFFFESAGNSGIDKDIAEELARRSGCPFALSLKPRARIWRELETGQLMMSSSAIPTAKRQEYAWFVILSREKNYVLVDKSVEARSAAQFYANPRLIFGTVRSFSHGAQADAFLDRLRLRSRVAEDADLKNTFRLFARGRTAAILTSAPAYAKYIDDMGLSDRIRIEDWFPEDPPIQSGLVFSKRHFTAEDIGKWRALVAAMHADGTLKRIYAKYLGPAIANDMLRAAAN